MKQKFYRLTNILKKNAEYNILLGQRSNGKSYAAKEYVLMDFFKNGNHFVYLRRFQIDIKSGAVEEYFADMPIEQMSDGRYNCITSWKGHLYLSTIDEYGKVSRGERIGEAHYLSGATHYKSRMFPNVYNIIYEEFISDDIYLKNEPTELLNYVSTILRQRNGKVFLVGNTISRVCPYFTEWNLRKIPEMTQGQIDTYEVQTNVEKNDGSYESVKIAVEFCEKSGKGSAMFFGSSAEHINGGAWKTEEMPHLELDINNYEKIYELQLKHMGFDFILKLLTNKNNGCIILFVEDNEEKRELKRVITKAYVEDFFVSPKLKKNIKPELLMANCIEQKKVAYADNLTGADFIQILKEMGGIY